MRPDFSLIWGSDNAPFTPIEASDYTAGWVFRTGAPPRRVNFDYWQNLSDRRTAWLGEQMLLAVGHEWQDDVTYNLEAYTRSPVDGKLYKSLDATNLNNEPSATPASWAEVPDLSSLTVSGQNLVTFLSAGVTAWPVPAGVKKVWVTVVGAGGGSAGGVLTGAGQLSCGGGGDAGGYALGLIDLTGVNSVPVTVGVGGSAGIGGVSNGGPGGSSSFGSYLSATGGAGGTSIAGGSAATFAGAGNTPGVGVGGSINGRGGVGFAGVRLTGFDGFGGAGGASILSGGGASRYSVGAGSAGIFGAGGGGGLSVNGSGAQNGAKGGDGVVIIRW